MTQLFRFTNVERVLLDQGAGRQSSHLCNCIEVRTDGDAGPCSLVLYDLYAGAPGPEIEPRLLALIRLQWTPARPVLREPDEIRESAFAHIDVAPHTTITVVPHDGECVRRDRWFGVSLPEDQAAIASAISTSQTAVALLERELRAYPDNDDFREHLVRILGHLSDRLEKLERRLASVQAGTGPGSR